MEQDSDRNTGSDPGMAWIQGLEKKYLYWLTRTPGFGAAIARRIWETVGSFENVCYIEGMGLGKQGVLRNEEKCRTYGRWGEQFSCMVREYDHLQERGIRLVMLPGRGYPKQLLHIYDHPMGLYIKGELPDEEYPTAAIIGVRDCTEHERQAAEFMGGELAEVGVQVVSGLTLGIDGTRHEGALKGEGRIYGVLGYGVNIYYPRSNYYLHETIPSQGEIISKFGPDEGPLARDLPMRNHIINGLPDMILIMEARKKSGSLVTVSLGLEQGEEIFALPDRIIDTLNAECDELIQPGVGILASSEDILEYMGIFHEKGCTNREKDQKGLAKVERMMYSYLDSEPKHPDQIMVQTGLSAGRCMSAPLELELGGPAVRTSGQNYTKIITQVSGFWISSGIRRGVSPFCENE